MSELELFLSDVCVVISGAPENTIDALRAGWSACEAPVMTSARTVRLAIEEEDDGLRIYSDGEHVGGSARREDLAFAIERFLYAAMPAWHAPPRVILHAAGVVLGETMLVLAGRSGAGKSSLARALTERGARYATDELVITDGERIWGIPRAIQFDAVPIDGPLPPWLGEVDRTLAVRMDHGRAVIPIVRPRDVQREPVSVERARVVVLERGDRTAIRDATFAEALAELHAGAFSTLATDLGGLARAPLYLTWDRADTGAEALLAHVDL